MLRTTYLWYLILAPCYSDASFIHFTHTLIVRTLDILFKILQSILTVKCDILTHTR